MFGEFAAIRPNISYGGLGAWGRWKHVNIFDAESHFPGKFLLPHQTLVQRYI